MKISILFILIWLGLFSCEKPPQPNELFYCKIDGKKFRPDNGGDVFYEALLVQWDKPNDLFYINTSGKNNCRLIIVKEKEVPFQTGVFEINKDYNSRFYGDYLKGTTDSEKFESIDGSGIFEITKIDTLKKRISGNFEYWLKSTDDGKVIKLTDGQFNDVLYY